MGQIDPYSGLKIDPEFRVKYVDPSFRVNLTQFASVAYWPGSGSRFDPIWVKFDHDLTRMFLEWKDMFTSVVKNVLESVQNGLVLTLGWSLTHCFSCNICIQQHAHAQTAFDQIT